MKTGLPGSAAAAGAGAQTPGGAALLGANGTAGTRGGVVDAGVSPEPPPIEPPAPEPARAKAAADARERERERRASRRKDVEPVSPASGATPGSNISDFGGRR